MEKQNELVIKILRRLSDADILDHVLLIGSWCGAFYKEYFRSNDYAPALRTRDIDFLVKARTQFPRKLDLEALLKDLGFETAFSGQGFMKLESEELILEMLIPEVGPAKDKPYPLPDLQFNATPLRHLGMLWRDPIEISIQGVKVRMPHPADYALHKIVIHEDRQNKDKKAKDREMAFEVLRALVDKGEQAILQRAAKDLTEKEQKRIRRALKEEGMGDLL